MAGLALDKFVTSMATVIEPYGKYDVATAKMLIRGVAGAVKAALVAEAQARAAAPATPSEESARAGPDAAAHIAANGAERGAGGAGTRVPAVNSAGKAAQSATSRPVPR